LYDRDWFQCHKVSVPFTNSFECREVPPFAALSVTSYFCPLSCASYLSFVIRNLPSSSEIAEVTVRALTAPDLRCADSLPLTRGEGALMTKDPSRHRLLQEQIEAAKLSTEEYIDTDFETVRPPVPSRPPSTSHPARK